jgi:hypothetical protein
MKDENQNVFTNNEDNELLLTNKPSASILEQRILALEEKIMKIEESLMYTGKAFDDLVKSLELLKRR